MAQDKAEGNEVGTRRICAGEQPITLIKPLSLLFVLSLLTMTIKA